MANVDEILNSMLEDMVKYQKEYDETTQQVNTIAKEYTDRINELQQQRLALQEEGNKKIEILESRRSQLSGMHSSLYEQYKKFAGKEPDFSKFKEKDVVTENKEEVKTEIIKPVVPKKDINTAKVQKKTEQAESKDTVKDSQLSPDEIAKLSEITDNTTSKKLTDSNGNEIPDYLADSYKK